MVKKWNSLKDQHRNATVRYLYHGTDANIAHQILNSQNSAELSPIAVDAVLKIVDPTRENNVNLKDIKIIKKLGGTIDDTELVDGLVFDHKTANVNGPKKIEKAKIGSFSFVCLHRRRTWT